MTNKTQRQFILLKRKYETAKAIAKIAKVSEGTVSRILSGEGRATWRAVKNLSTGLPHPEGAQLLSAFLGDRIPKPLRKVVRVQINHYPSLDEILGEVSPECVEMLERLARLCAENEEISQVFNLHIKLLTEKLHNYLNESPLSSPSVENKSPPRGS